MLSDSSGTKPANPDKFFGCRAEDRGATLNSRNGSQRHARSRQVGAKSITGSHTHAASHDRFRSAVEPSARGSFWAWMWIGFDSRLTSAATMLYLGQGSSCRRFEEGFLREWNRLSQLTRLFPLRPVSQKTANLEIGAPRVAVGLRFDMARRFLRRNAAPT